MRQVSDGGQLRSPQPDGLLLPRSSLLLTVEEVRQLWAFVHGDIMDGGIRTLLRASLGLCPRHTWAYAVVEIELWQTGGGLRGGHQPFDVTVLYEDLLEHVAAGLTRPATPFRRHPESILVPSGPCRVCTELVPSGHAGMRLGYAASNSSALADEANLLTWTRRWCIDTAPIWRPMVCPRCQEAPQKKGREVDAAGLLCRPHLLSLGRLSPTLREEVAARLRELQGRMRRLTASMTKYGAPATPQDDASWVETLGFFAGWGPPLHLADITAHADERTT
jgi:hypothetical protein